MQPACQEAGGRCPGDDRIREVLAKVNLAYLHQRYGPHLGGGGVGGGKGV